MRADPVEFMTKRLKKIAVEQLRPGMYIHDLNCDWMSHPCGGDRILGHELPEKWHIDPMRFL